MTGTTSTLNAVRAHGKVRAVVSQGIRGLSLPDGQGSWSGLDADVARAVAVAVLGDAGGVEWLPTDPAERLTRLVSGAADVATCNLSWTLGREAAEPVLFAGITCYDGEGFLVRTTDAISGPEQLAGRRVAIQAGTTTASNLAAWFGARGLQVEPIAYATPAEALAAYADGACSAYVLDRIALAGARATLPRPADHTVLEAAISREPMALAVRDDDPAWFRVCRWVLQFLIGAEHAVREEGSPRAAQAAADQAGKHGQALGLDEDWARRVLDAVGTYGDVYDRNLGAASGLDIGRGPNAPWADGGLHYPLPLH
ncbi:transporter substrate-binding domain-containing protein [Streptomyces sp. MP131-18]|uniref:transporter substrate-binding domain-containing protein n=1 Tax=Streptomyces sp. MP131-18 TaxID=1857892 RepID=UPI00097C7479|nr:transporter substrate-binding domain-containing protein [Streptomyces sp. MP131-18]ONK11832.1 General L-amino acid-binding periplasmic proteinAapJ precursor [Streptomyces sp. MP131-18]